MAQSSLLAEPLGHPCGTGKKCARRSLAAPASRSRSSGRQCRPTLGGPGWSVVPVPNVRVRPTRVGWWQPSCTARDCQPNPKPGHPSNTRKSTPTVGCGPPVPPAGTRARTDSRVSRTPSLRTAGYTELRGTTDTSDSVPRAAGPISHAPRLAFPAPFVAIRLYLPRARIADHWRMATPRHLLVDPVNECDYHLVSRRYERGSLLIPLDRSVGDVGRGVRRCRGGHRDPRPAAPPQPCPDDHGRKLPAAREVAAQAC